MHASHRRAISVAFTLIFLSGSLVSGQSPPPQLFQLRVAQAPAGPQVGVADDQAVRRADPLDNNLGRVDLPKVVDGQVELPPLRVPSTDVDAIGTGAMPENYARNMDDRVIPLPEGPGRTGQWVISTQPWHASNTFNHPLYFEDRMLERHGHQRYPLLTPFISGARFFGTFPALPYLMTIDPPCEFDYSLGYYRAGSPVPRFLQRPPFDQEAAATEAAAIAAGIWAIP